MNYNKLSIEEKLIIKILFSENKLSNKDLKLINIENLVKISSIHLVIPLLYIKIKEKKIEALFPNEFISYIREIYKINLNRNLELIKEIKLLSEIFSKKSVKHIFIKGSAMILNRLYTDIGERMIGDIDILIDANDKASVIKILEEIKFESKWKHLCSFERHLPRMVSKNSIFAIEPHIRLTDKGQHIDEKALLNKNMNKKTPCLKDMLLINIYNSQINDNFHFSFAYSFRNLYDSFILIKKLKLNNVHSLNEKNKVINFYFFIIKSLNILDLKINKIGVFRKIIIYSKLKIKPIFSIYRFFIKTFLLLKINFLKTREIILNDEYRSYVFSKFRFF